ncbi:MAG: hypothetical protein KME42_21060 [Tildeniella nuda ZEHNDER 1965/U140]|jgi:hypothetical protein|nr:hypothetical protein [Tildeniella nuda ZEHNDER 1965/U140]
MKIIRFLEITILSFRSLIARLCFPHFSRYHTVILCTLLLLTVISIKSLADPPSAARVINFQGSRSDFWIHRHPKDRGIGVAKGVEMKNGGSLSVPTKDYSASFGFVTPDEKYKGVIIQTYDKGTYTFPCQIQGHFIIAWSGKGGRACSASRDGIRDAGENDILRIEHSSSKTLSHLPKPVERAASIIGLGNKQNSDKQGDDNLAISPAKGQTLLRTSSNISTSYDYANYRDVRPDNYDFECATKNSAGSAQTCRWKCTTENTPSGAVRECVWSPMSTTTENVDNRYNYRYKCIVRDTPSGSGNTPGSWSCTWDWKPILTENVSIEAFEGDILVKSKENPKGAQVKEGQKFSYPGGKVDSINVGKEANTCEMLKFLNAAYWSSPETPKSVSDSIAEQLKQHRQALGVSGRPPTNLSALEKGVINEINLARTNPGGYAKLLESQKQYFHKNWLKLNGEPLIPTDKRIRAVDEAIDFVQSKQSLPAFSVSTGMSRASRDHVEYQGKISKNFGHTGDDGKGYEYRLRRRGSVGCVEGENISYYDPSTVGTAVPEARVAVMEFLTRDGLRKAGERDNPFNPDFQVVGVACGQHEYLRFMCDITYAGGFLEKN